jgi:hypothetical protein
LLKTTIGGTMHAMPLALTDNQLAILTTAAADVPLEKRSTFIERFGAVLALKGRFDDADVADTVRLACAGLVRRKHDAA